MYYRLFRWFPKHGFSRLMGVLARAPWPSWLLEPVIRLYIAAFRIDMAQFVAQAEPYPTFTAFFTRAVRPERRPIDARSDALVSPVDGAVIEGGEVRRGRLIQAKGLDYGLGDLLGEAPGWERYDGGHFITLYLSPRDYHRIHSPCRGRVTRFAYLPGDLWTVSPTGVGSVPGLFARNERLVTFLETDFGEVALVAVGATVVGRIRVVYHAITSDRPGAWPLSAPLDPPFPLERGQELGRFELGSTVILLLPPGAARLDALQAGDAVRMGQTVAHAGV
jgi:phosphatidylserine decarboxylase